MTGAEKGALGFGWVRSLFFIGVIAALLTSCSDKSQETTTYRIKTNKGIERIDITNLVVMNSNKDRVLVIRLNPEYESTGGQNISGDEEWQVIYNGFGAPPEPLQKLHDLARKTAFGPDNDKILLGPQGYAYPNNDESRQVFDALGWRGQFIHAPDLSDGAIITCGARVDKGIDEKLVLPCYYFFEESGISVTIVFSLKDYDLREEYRQWAISKIISD